MKNVILTVALWLGLFPVFTFASSDMNSADREWHFTVYLDDKEIGYHRFSVTRDGEKRRVISEARFDVRFWFINAYKYRHYNREIWRNDCLIEVDAATDDNGELSQVRARRDDDQLNFSRPENKSLAGCIRSFAYWVPQYLDSPRLLNTQTGEYQDVELMPLGKDDVTVGGQVQQANRYRIRNEKFRIDLWYSDQDQWLALESTTEGGATLRYRIQ
ncbi:MAG: DUF6134 family protein [Thiohalophilus sp.]|uniref:DUF6134 family protein n=1 Tax=Thiohalophilus sp. TaxID=3028392 RepID=UPI00286FBBE0|nr:DUF6134 family protein [Thiohalophilus sp.]MDR9435935.1 DUF6134 family protein [Thiohalophilus sp.]